METSTLANPLLPGSVAGLPSYVAAYVKSQVALDDAQELFGFSRTSFFRFRRRHAIATLPGRKISLADIVAAFESERRRNTGYSGVAVEDSAAYRDKLLTLGRAAEVFGLSTTDFWRLRLRHRISKLSGNQVHVDDVIAALEAERRRQRS